MFEVSEVFVRVCPTFDADDDRIRVPKLVSTEVPWVGVFVQFIICVVVGNGNEGVSLAWSACDGVLRCCSFGLFHAFYALPSWVGLL